MFERPNPFRMNPVHLPRIPKESQYNMRFTITKRRTRNRVIYGFSVFKGEEKKAFRFLKPIFETDVAAIDRLKAILTEDGFDEELVRRIIFDLKTQRTGNTVCTRDYHSHTSEASIASVPISQYFGPSDP